ncbi:MAG TPA: TlpA disulfide reductase family protein [Rubrivivax sp.]|jgi:cytochrome c biogenesis protein CcmG/thiol:disulfide interchange protein DsbE|nr:TlpA disulfide reductase family protein [Rubrivivax sp.]
MCDRRNVLAVPLAALLGTVLAAPALALEDGQPAPDIALPGSTVAARLSDLRGRLVYVDFWASWCGPCRQSFPWMNEMHRKYAARGLVVLGINVDARRADADAFLARTPAEFPLAFDASGDAPRAFQVKGMPSSVLVDAQGRVRFSHRGFRLEDRAELESRIVAALPR